MYCGHCGAKAQENQTYCNTCGRPVAAATRTAATAGAGTMPSYGVVRGRVAEHVRVLGVLWMVMSAFHLLPGIFLLFLPLHHGFPLFIPMVARGIVAPILFGVGCVILVSAVAGLLAGWGLLDRQPWARILALVLGFLNLLHMPLGTALGIYTIWVLIPPESGAEYARLARRAP